MCILSVRRAVHRGLSPWGRRGGKGQCGETSCNAPDAKKGTHKQHGHRSDNTHTLRGVRHDTQAHAVTHTFIHSHIHTFTHSYIHVSQQHAVRTRKHADARVTARTVQCLLKTLWLSACRVAQGCFAAPFPPCGLSPLTYDMTVPDTRFFFSDILFGVEQTFAISTAAAIVFEDTTRIVYATVVDDLDLLLRLVACVPSASLVLLVHRMEHAGNVVSRPATTWHGFCVLRPPIHKVFAVPADAVDARRVLACSLPNVFSSVRCCRASGI